jgi:hypothetical protein
VDFLRKRLPAQVGRYLEGVEFPARKEELLGRLERNGVPGPVIGQLRKRLPEGEYRGPQDVLKALRGGVSRASASAAAGSRAFHGRPSFRTLSRRSSQNASSTQSGE